MGVQNCDPANARTHCQSLLLQRRRGTRKVTLVVSMPGGGLVSDETRACEALKQALSVSEMNNPQKTFNLTRPFVQSSRTRLPIAQYASVAQADSGADELGATITEKEIALDLLATKFIYS